MAQPGFSFFSVENALLAGPNSRASKGLKRLYRPRLHWIWTKPLHANGILQTGDWIWRPNSQTNLDEGLPLGIAMYDKKCPNFWKTTVGCVLAIFHVFVVFCKSRWRNSHDKLARGITRPSKPSTDM